MPCVPIFRKNRQLWFFRPKFAQKWILGLEFRNRFWGWNFKNLSLDSESGSLRYYVHQFSDKMDNFEFLGPNLPKNGFWGRNFKNLSLDSESIFSQNGKLLIFWPKFGEIVQLRAIFWFKYCWGCCRELGGSWNELGGGGWSLVEMGARFSNTRFIDNKHISPRFHCNRSSLDLNYYGTRKFQENFLYKLAKLYWQFDMVGMNTLYKESIRVRNKNKGKRKKKKKVNSRNSVEESFYEHIGRSSNNTS